MLRNVPKIGLAFIIFFIAFFARFEAHAVSNSQQYCFNASNDSALPLRIVSNTGVDTTLKPGTKDQQICSTTNFKYEFWEDNCHAEMTDSTDHDTYRFCSGSDVTSDKCNSNNTELPSFTLNNKTRHPGIDNCGTVTMDLQVSPAEDDNSTPHPIPYHDTKTTHILLDTENYHPSFALQPTTPSETENVGSIVFSELPGQNNSVMLLNSLDSFPSTNLYYNDPKNQFPIPVANHYLPDPDFTLNPQRPPTSETPFLVAPQTGGDMNSAQEYDLSYPGGQSFFGQPFSFVNADGTPGPIKVTKDAKYVAYYPDFFNNQINVEVSNKELPQGFYELSYENEDRDTSHKELLYSNGSGNICNLTYEKNGLQLFHDMGGGYTGTENWNDKIGVFRIFAGNQPLQDFLHKTVFDQSLKNRIFPDCQPLQSHRVLKKTKKSTALNQTSQTTLTTDSSEPQVYSDENGNLYKIQDQQYCTYKTLFDFYTDTSIHNPADRMLGKYGTIMPSQLTSYDNTGDCVSSIHKITKMGNSDFLPKGNSTVQISLKDLYPNCDVKNDLSLFFTYYDSDGPNGYYPMSSSYPAGSNYSQDMSVGKEENPNLTKYKTLKFHTGSESADGKDLNLLGTDPITIPKDKLATMCQAGDSLWIKKQLFMYQAYLILNAKPPAKSSR